MSGFLLEMQSISKAFPGVKALQDVSFNLKAGEVHALVGENGAGKSTLMKILGGMYLPDGGDILLSGEKVSIRSPIDSLRKRISVIYQEFNLVPTLSVSENIFLGKELRTGIGSVDRKAMLAMSREIIKSLGLSHLDCTTLVSDLSVAQQQMVEIAKALFNDCSIVVMDEPTAVLTDSESEALFTIIRELQKKNVGIVYISHRLEEVIRLADRITVLRDGTFVTEIDNTGHHTKKEAIVHYMVGRELTEYYPRRAVVPEEENVIEVRDLSCGRLFHDISFSLRKKEILGFFGLVGAGRTEVMKSIFGAIRPQSGTIRINGHTVSIQKPVDAIGNALALVPENRKQEGLVLPLGAVDNIALPNAKKISRFGRVLKKRKYALANQYAQELSIRPLDIHRAAESFSGGNQQKIVLSKWLAANPSVMILDEPTRGIDVAAKKELYNIINRMTVDGVSIIVVSSEMLEVLGICDRVIVMHEGRITGEFLNDGMVTQEQLMACAAGIAQKTA